MLRPVVLGPPLRTFECPGRPGRPGPLSGRVPDRESELSPRIIDASFLPQLYPPFVFNVFQQVLSLPR